MDIDKVLGYCDEIDALTQSIRTEVAGSQPEPIDELIIRNAGDLQASMTAGGDLALADSLVCQEAGGYKFNTSRTNLRGIANNKIIAETNPALRVDVNVDDISIGELEVVSTQYDSVIRLGKNDTSQVTVDQAPNRISIRAIDSSGHRGKRVIEVNAANVEIFDCELRDIYSPNKQDSQAIWIGNAPGPILVSGGYYEAASECLMIGGDALKIPNCRPTGITIRNATFTKNLAWKGNVDIPVKNLLELKDGHDVLIENCELFNCWKSAQDGYAFMFTPTRGGSLRNVVVRNCRVNNVGGIVNITGIDDSATNPPRTQVSIFGGEYRTNKEEMGGSGRFCLIGRGPERFIVEDALIRHEGSSFIDISDKAPIDTLYVLGCDWNYGAYGIRIGGYNHGDNSLGQVKDMRVEGNVISGAHSQFKERWPNNSYA